MVDERNLFIHGHNHIMIVPFFSKQKPINVNNYFYMFNCLKNLFFQLSNTIFHHFLSSFALKWAYLSQIKRLFKNDSDSESASKCICNESNSVHFRWVTVVLAYTQVNPIIVVFLGQIRQGQNANYKTSMNHFLSGVQGHGIYFLYKYYDITMLLTYIVLSEWCWNSVL